MKLPISPHTSEHERLIRATAASINALYRPHLAADHHAPNLSEEVEGELTALLRAFSQSGAHQMERLDVTILLSDVRGFTSLFEEVFADEVIWLLNQYFSTMSDIITRHHGRVDKFMGDSIMAVFSMPTDDMQTPLQAVICAAEMQLAMDGLNTSFKQSGLPEVFMGIGINTGQVMAGTIGSELHREYTIIGDEVNLASRIEAYSLRGQILISERTYTLTSGNIEAGEGVEVYVKGKQAPVTLYEVLAITTPVSLSVPRRELRKSPRVEVQLPFEFQCVKNKAIATQTHKGQILDISFHGLRIESPIELTTLSEIKLQFEFINPLADHQDVYAKVIRSWHTSNGTKQFGLEFTSIGIAVSRGIRKFIQYSLDNKSF